MGIGYGGLGNGYAGGLLSLANAIIDSGSSNPAQNNPPEMNHANNNDTITITIADLEAASTLYSFKNNQVV